MLVSEKRGVSVSGQPEKDGEHLHPASMSETVLLQRQLPQELPSAPMQNICHRMTQDYVKLTHVVNVASLPDYPLFLSWDLEWIML